MRHKKLKLTALFFLLGVGLTGLQAQETVTTAGGNSSGSGGTISYTIGQVAYSTNTGTSGSVAEGVQQPYEISVETGIEQTAINLAVSAYPNPTTDFLTLKVDNSDFSGLSFYLYDINGKLLQSKKLEGSETRIEMSNLIAATYFVKVTKSNHAIKTFKIIKN